MTKDKSSSSKPGKPNLIDVAAALNLSSSNTFFCNTCKESKPKPIGSTTSFVKSCFECKEKKRQEERASYLADLAELPIEERVAKLASAIYDLRQRSHVCSCNIKY